MKKISLFGTLFLMILAMAVAPVFAATNQKDTMNKQYHKNQTNQSSTSDQGVRSDYNAGSSSTQSGTRQGTYSTPKSNGTMRLINQQKDLNKSNNKYADESGERFAWNKSHTDQNKKYAWEGGEEGGEGGDE